MMRRYETSAASVMKPSTFCRFFCAVSDGVGSAAARIASSRIALQIDNGQTRMFGAASAYRYHVRQPHALSGIRHPVLRGSGLTFDNFMCGCVGRHVLIFVRAANFLLSSSSSSGVICPSKMASFSSPNVSPAFVLIASSCAVLVATARKRSTSDQP